MEDSPGIKWSLGIRGMLTDAIYRHVEADPRNRLPKRFEMHPTVFFDLLAESHYGEMYRSADRAFFRGVEVLPVNNRPMPVMITAFDLVKEL